VQRAVDGTSTAPPPGERAIGLGRSGRVMGTQGGVMHGIDGARPGGTEEREALSLTDPEPRLCLICAELTEELICGTCSARIQGEAIVRKREDERGAAV